MQAILSVLGKIMLSLLTSLLTERVLKNVIIILLEKLVDKTETDLDNKLLEECKKAWADK